MTDRQITTVSLPQLIQLLADLTGTDATETHKFIHEFFALTQECLAQQQAVRIKGIGTFAVESSESGEVRFSPDPELAAAVNAPFAMFSPVELGDGISAEDLEPESDTVTDSRPDASEYVVTIDEPCQQPEVYSEPEPEPELKSEPEPEPELPQEEPAREVTADEKEEEVEVETADENIKAPRRIKGYLITAVVALALGFAIGYYTHLYLQPETTGGAEAIEPLTVADSIVRQSTTDSTITESKPRASLQLETPAPEIRDTISRDCFLATMARRHYGHMEYWVYIYEANPGLGHPDRIKPGTVVTIPPESEFALGSDSATMSRAMRLYAEIYGRYKP